MSERTIDQLLVALIVLLVIAGIVMVFARQHLVYGVIFGVTALVAGYRQRRKAGRQTTAAVDDPAGAADDDHHTLDDVLG